MFPLSQPALCLDARGGGERRVFMCWGGGTLKQRVQGRKEGAAEGGGKSQMSQGRRSEEGDGGACFSKSH